MSVNAEQANILSLSEASKVCSKIKGELVQEERLIVLLRLLELPNEVRELMKQQKLTMGHARALLALPANQQSPLAVTIVAKNLTVRETEQAIRKIINGGQKAPKSGKKDPNIQNLENIIADTLGAAVVIKQGANSKKGKIEIQYNDLDELDGILRKIGAQS